LAQTGSSNVGTGDENKFASVEWRRTVTAHLKHADLEAATPIVEQKVVNLALQGGGSHGAFTWGVLDRLLEDRRLVFDGITATSAGAINAVVLADGFALGGREGARNALKNFWQKMSKMASSSIIAPLFSTK
jgi:NTE family protein